MTTEVDKSITNGYNSKQYIDLVASKGEKSLYVQVGRVINSGRPVLRERQAIEDLASISIKVIFVPYN